MGLEANGARCRLDPPRQWQGPLAKAQRQHQNLMAVGDLRLIQDQDHGLARGRRPVQNLTRKRFHDLVADDQGIAEKARDPLVTHVRPVCGSRQPGRQVHQVHATHIQHRGHQERQLLPLGFTLAGQPLLEVCADAARNSGDAVHNACPGSAEGGILQSHADSRRQYRSFQN